MKILFVFLSVTLSLAFFTGCEETEESVVTPRHLETVRGVPERIQQIEVSRYPKGWVHLTDSDVVELLELTLPKRWWEIQDEGLRKKYEHAFLLEQFGDRPEVRFIIEAQRNTPWTPEISLKFIECHYIISPTKENKRLLKRARQQLEEDLHDRFHGPPIRKRQAFTIQDAQAARAALIKKHGDIPQVQIVGDFLLKMAMGETFTLDEIFAFRKAKFELDPDDQPNRAIFEAYLAAKAAGLPLHTVKEKEVIEEWLDSLERD